jgi:hypothetical protein
MSAINDTASKYLSDQTNRHPPLRLAEELPWVPRRQLPTGRGRVNGAERQCEEIAPGGRQSSKNPSHYQHSRPSCDRDSSNTRPIVKAEQAVAYLYHGPEPLKRLFSEPAIIVGWICGVGGSSIRRAR